MPQQKYFEYLKSVLATEDDKEFFLNEYIKAYPDLSKESLKEEFDSMYTVDEEILNEAWKELAGEDEILRAEIIDALRRKEGKLPKFKTKNALVQTLS